MSKYYLSLCCIIKNERYLEEFIMYHSIVGVEHFYIYDNESDIKIRDRLCNPYFSKMCTIIDYPGKNLQMSAYNHCINNFKYETRWLAIVDGDEYILPKHHFQTVRDFLHNYEDAHAIGINWVFFGSSYYSNVQDGYLVDKYRYCQGKQDDHIKTIIQPQYVKECHSPHHVVLYDPSKYIDSKRNIIGNNAFNTNYTIDLIQINHYHLRSYEDYQNKYNRGNADTDNRVRNIPLDEYHNLFNNVIDNYLPDKYLNEMIKRFIMINTNISIYKALNNDIYFNTLEEYYDHLHNYAITQNRHCHIWQKYPNFNRDIYRQNYPDLVHLSDQDVEIHYITQGSNEGRIWNVRI
jgi:hypothetical protein